MGRYHAGNGLYRRTGYAISSPSVGFSELLLHRECYLPNYCGGCVPLSKATAGNRWTVNFRLTLEWIAEREVPGFDEPPETVRKLTVATVGLGSAGACSGSSTFGQCRRHHNHGSPAYTPSLGVPAVSPTTTAVEHESLSSISVSTSNSTAILLDPSFADTKDKDIPSMTF